MKSSLIDLRAGGFAALLKSFFTNGVLPARGGMGRFFGSPGLIPGLPPGGFGRDVGRPGRVGRGTGFTLGATRPGLMPLGLTVWGRATFGALATGLKAPLALKPRASAVSGVSMGNAMLTVTAKRNGRSPLDIPFSF